MSKTALSNHDATKAAVQSLLRNGLATYAEIATVSGRSRQLVRKWARALDAESAREERVAKLWARALRKTE